MARPFADADRSLFWTLAIVAFAAAAVALACRAVDRAAAHYEAERAGYAVVRVIAPEGPDAIALAVAALADAPHVTRAAPMSSRRAAQLLQQWGGRPIDPATLPALRLIELELEPSPAQADVGGDITAALARAGVTADVVRAPETAGGGTMAARARAAALWGGAAFAIVMALIVSLAARGLATRRRELVAVLADMGATRGQAASRVANEAAAKGFLAGAVGAVFAAALGAGLILLLYPGATVASLRQLIGVWDVAPLALTPFAAAAAAAMGARAGAESFYAQAARLT
ncbi:MAG TPA: hypothetical protein VG841_12040 [Caulobacterales bacterium]|nr:hypothetical protein [Caulobacterales bacterium]